ncbi:hypothetical protein EI067_27080 [Mycobacterium paragordonae]|nr:hypothetical protein EI067_27080 [Mycobacterium paragordonae]
MQFKGSLLLDLDGHNELVICRPLRLTLPAPRGESVEEIMIDPGNVPVGQRSLLDLTGATCTRADCGEDGHLHLEFSSGHQVDVADRHGSAWELHGNKPSYMSAPIVITEKAVAFGTAAATLMRPTTKRWWTHATDAAHSAAQRIFLASTADRQQRSRHRQPRFDYLEASCMEREMRRL